MVTIWQVDDTGLRSHVLWQAYVEQGDGTLDPESVLRDALDKASGS